MQGGFFFPMFFVYILENPNGRFYVGQTDDLERRVRQHNTPEGHVHLGKFTHKNGPWTLVWSEPHPSRSDAVRREKEIKSWKSPSYIRRKLLPGSSLSALALTERRRER